MCRAPSVGSPGKITVEVADTCRLADIDAAWRDLVSRAAELNVFAEPAFIGAAARASSTGSPRAVLAWGAAGGQFAGCLLGAWPCILAKLSPQLPRSVLRAPIHDLAFLATPVIDGAHVEPVLTAMLDALAADRTLPKLMMLIEMTSDGPVMAALRRVLHRRGHAPAILRQTQRPVLHPNGENGGYFERSVSSSVRKKLRQHRRRLAKHGPVVFAEHSRPEDVCARFEEFLTLESSGWKGREGTALLSDKEAAAFSREFIAALARDGLATIAALHVSGRPVAMQVLLRSGASAFTWKVAYDEAFRDFSPGILLLEDLTAALFADRQIKVVDSCCYNDETYMADFWKERQPMADILIDVRRGRTLSFTMTKLFEQTYRLVREAAKAAYRRLRLHFRRPR